MPKVRFTIMTLAVVMLLLLPTVALAQPEVCGYYGSIMLDDKAIEDGTMLTASVDGEDVSTAVIEDSMYSIKVAGDFHGKDVDFSLMIDDRMVVVETADWVAGENNNLDIDAVTPPPDAIGPATISLKPDSGVATNVCGTGFTPNRTVTITWDGDKYSTVKADAMGSFCAPLIPPTDTESTFTVAASDDQNRSDSATFEVVAAIGEPGPQGAQGPDGPSGPPGPAGEKGDDGDDAGSVLAIVALIIAIVAVILSIVFMMRGKQEAAA